MNLRTPILALSVLASAGSLAAQERPAECHDIDTTTMHVLYEQDGSLRPAGDLTGIHVPYEAEALVFTEDRPLRQQERINGVAGQQRSFRTAPGSIPLHGERFAIDDVLDNIAYDGGRATIPLTTTLLTPDLQLETSGKKDEGCTAATETYLVPFARDPPRDTPVAPQRPPATERPPSNAPTPIVCWIGGGIGGLVGAERQEYTAGAGQDLSRVTEDYGLRANSFLVEGGVQSPGVLLHASLLGYGGTKTTEGENYDTQGVRGNVLLDAGYKGVGIGGMIIMDSRTDEIPDTFIGGNVTSMAQGFLAGYKGPSWTAMAGPAFLHVSTENPNVPGLKTVLDGIGVHAHVRGQGEIAHRLDGVIDFTAYGGLTRGKPIDEPQDPFAVVAAHVSAEAMYRLSSSVTLGGGLEAGIVQRGPTERTQDFTYLSPHARLRFSF